MSDELIKELSRLQLLSSRYKDKMSMCPLHITREENRAYLIFHYIKQLQQQNQKYKGVIDKINKYIMSNLIDEYDIKYGGCVSGSDLPVGAITPLLDILKEVE